MPSVDPEAYSKQLAQTLARAHRILGGKKKNAEALLASDAWRREALDLLRALKLDGAAPEPPSPGPAPEPPPPTPSPPPPAGATDRAIAAAQGKGRPFAARWEPAKSLLEQIERALRAGDTRPPVFSEGVEVLRSMAERGQGAWTADWRVGNDGHHGRDFFPSAAEALTAYAEGRLRSKEGGVS